MQSSLLATLRMPGATVVSEFCFHRTKENIPIKGHYYVNIKLSV